MSHWISIKDRRPPSMITVLLAISRNNNKDVICGWDESTHPEEDPSFCPCESWIDMSDIEITHWQLLPEPPK